MPQTWSTEYPEHRSPRPWQLKVSINKKEPRSVPLYQKVCWEEVKQRLRVFATNYFTANKDAMQPINTNWSDIKCCITTCVADLIPHKSIGTRFHLPCTTKPILRKIRKRQSVYWKAKKSSRQKDWDQCHTLKKINQARTECSIQQLCEQHAKCRRWCNWCNEMILLIHQIITPRLIGGLDTEGQWEGCSNTNREGKHM